MSDKINGYDIDVLRLGSNCPGCGHSQFAISPLDRVRPADLPSYVIGTSECRNCQVSFFVQLAPELKELIMASVDAFGARTAKEVIEVLFESED